MLALEFIHAYLLFFFSVTVFFVKTCNVCALVWFYQIGCLVLCNLSTSGEQSMFLQLIVSHLCLNIRTV